MKFYISQLTETKNIVPILEKYEVGLEAVQFAHPYYLDNRYEMVEEYKKELGEIYEDIDLIIHGPYADLSPGTRDYLIREITKHRMNQAYEVANLLGASKIVYHNGYTPKTYSYIEWKESAYNYWRDFTKAKKHMDMVVENVLDENCELMEDLMKRIGSNNFKMCLDIGHVNSYSKDSIDKWLDIMGSSISHIHLHNNYGDKDNHRGINVGNIDVFQTLDKIEKINSNITI